MADLDPEMCAQVYVDWEYRKVWDTYVLSELIICVYTIDREIHACVCVLVCVCVFLYRFTPYQR